LVQTERTLRGSAVERIDVIGQTDALPLARRSRYRSNQELGLMRAAVIRDLLVSAGGIDAGKIFLQSNSRCADSDQSHCRTALVRVIRTEMPTLGERNGQ
jgi:outer membrane protein OmpA-like peptidoglycan-associated protein